MSETLRPLALYPFPATPADLQMIREVKVGMDLPYSVRPVQAVPAGPTRILALRTAPTWLADHALVTNPTHDAIFYALRWVFKIVEEDSRASTILQQIQGIFPGATETTGRVELSDLVEGGGVRFR